MSLFIGNYFLNYEFRIEAINVTEWRCWTPMKDSLVQEKAAFWVQYCQHRVGCSLLLNCLEYESQNNVLSLSSLFLGSTIQLFMAARANWASKTDLSSTELQEKNSLHTDLNNDGNEEEKKSHECSSMLAMHRSTWTPWRLFSNSSAA